MEYVPFTEDPANNLIQFGIPALIMGAAFSGTMMRFVRTMMLEVLRQDYIRTAWSKGLSERTVIFRHALRNTLIPMVTIVGKQGVTWTHAKSDRAPSPSPVQVAGQPETVTELIDLAGASPETDGNLPEGLEEGSADPAARDAARAEFSSWLSFNETSGSLRITGFDTLREPIGRKACRARHDEIVQAFDVDQSRARVLADQPVMFQSRICAANGEIVITCQGSDAVISPRRARPDSA